MRLNYHAANYHFAQSRMQRLEVEDQVELAYVLKKAVKGLYEDLNQIEQGKRRFGRGGDDDEVKCRIVAVCDERGGVVVWRSGGR